MKMTTQINFVEQLKIRKVKTHKTKAPSLNLAVIILSQEWLPGLSNWNSPSTSHPIYQCLHC